MRTSLFLCEKKGMPFLHIGSENRHKEEWEALVKDHPCKFEIITWTPEQDRDHLYRSQPEVDPNLFPRTCISVAAALQKLVDYGGIVVRGEDTRPIRGIKIIIEDWKTAGPPKKLTVRGYHFPTFVDKTTIMVSPQSEDTVAKSYLDVLVENMKHGVWRHPTFTNNDVSTL